MSGPGDSYAGITVPEGDPGGLSGAASEFGALAGQLSGVSAELQGMPGTLSTWNGPASVSFAGACLTNHSACRDAVDAFTHAESAARRYAPALRHAQHEAEAAIAQARAAQHRIDAAERAIDDARQAQSA